MWHWLLTNWHWLVMLYAALLTGTASSAVIVDLRRDNT